MRPGVARDLVARAGDPPHGLGRARGALADEEERRARVLLRQDLQHPRREVAVGAIVEGESDAPACPGAAPDAGRRQQVGAPRVGHPRACDAEREPGEEHGPHATFWALRREAG